LMIVAVTPMFAALIADAMPCSELFEELIVTVFAPLPFEVNVVPASSATPVPEAVAAEEMTKLLASVIDTIVAPLGIPAPTIVAPTERFAVEPETVVDPLVVDALNVAPVCNETEVPEAVAGEEMTKLFASVMDAMVDPIGMPLPDIAAPTARLAVPGTVTVVDPLVVVALREVPYFPVAEFTVLPLMVPKSKVRVVVPPAPMAAVWFTTPGATKVCACASVEILTEYEPGVAVVEAVAVNAELLDEFAFIP